MDIKCEMSDKSREVLKPLFSSEDGRTALIEFGYELLRYMFTHPGEFINVEALQASVDKEGDEM